MVHNIPTLINYAIVRYYLISSAIKETIDNLGKALFPRRSHLLGSCKIQTYSEVVEEKQRIEEEKQLLEEENQRLKEERNRFMERIVNNVKNDAISLAELERAFRKYPVTEVLHLFNDVNSLLAQCPAWIGYEAKIQAVVYGRVESYYQVRQVVNNHYAPGSVTFGAGSTMNGNVWQRAEESEPYRHIEKKN